MKKTLIIVVCICMVIMLADKGSKTKFPILITSVEALSSCEAEYHNKDGELVHVRCAGEKGTCNIKKEDKINTPLGTVTVEVNATCSGIEVK